MPDATIVKGIRRKYNALVEDLDERGRRRWAATEAESIGYGGIVAVAQPVVVDVNLVFLGDSAGWKIVDGPHALVGNGANWQANK